MIRCVIILIILLFLNLVSMCLFILEQFWIFKRHCFNAPTHTHAHTHTYIHRIQIVVHFVSMPYSPRHSISLHIQLIMYLMWFAMKMIYHRVKRFIWMPRCHLPQKGFLISHAYALTKRKDTFIHSHTFYTLNVDQTKLHRRSYVFFSRWFWIYCT